MRSVINITGIIDDDVSTGTIYYLLDTVGVSKVDIKTYPQFDDWKESLPAEPIAGLSAACLRWIHSWGNGGGDRSSETMITEVIRELNSDTAPELADAIFGSVSGYSKSEFDAQGLTIELINGCIGDLCEEKSAGVTGIRGNQLLVRREGQSSAATGKN